jgi:diguanylate cyclase (GGDEF)-like protein/PAS domain S-box-containing protein
VSLKWRFLVIATVAMLCAIATVLATTANGFGRKYEAALQSRALVIGQGLQSQLERLLQLGIRVDDLVGFEEQCRQVVQAYAGIESAFVLDRAGQLLFHSTPGAEPPALASALLAAVAQGREAVVEQPSGPAAGHYSAVPVRDHRGEVVASIVVAIADDQVQSEVRSSLHSAVAVGALVLLASLVLLNGTLVMFVTRPLDSLNRTIAKLREDPGSTDRRAQLSSGDELGQLGRAFNELIDQLQRTTVSKAELEQALLQLRQTSDALFAQKERAEVTLRSIADGVVVVDAQGRVGYVNPAARRLAQWAEAEPTGRPVKEVLGLVDGASGEPVALDQAGGREVDLLQRDGSRVGVDWRAAEIHDREGHIAGSVLTFRDVSAEREHAQQRRWEATHDVLTGLVNRREFEARLDAALAARRAGGRSHVVCFLDLDRFKLVNDTCGHAAGDALLREVTQALLSRVRETDTLARLGGDEFALLLEGCSLERAQFIAADLLAAVRDIHVGTEGRTLHVGASIGLAAMHGELSAADVMGQADTACYLAKEQGRDRVCVYSDNDGDMATRRRETSWVARIEAALAQDRFVLYQQRYRALQPSAGARQHLEVLVRMRDEDGSIIAPGSFLPAAERYGLMPRIDRWIIRQVFAGYHRLLQAQGGPALTCAINLSGTTLNAEGLIDFIREQAQAHALPPGAICFEITETAAVNNLRQAAVFIEQCKAMGFEFALDDFGTGSSSFRYLRRLPVDYLKIDGSFVKQMHRDAVDRAMTESINQIGHLMGIRTVAEYAENDEIIEALRVMGVDFAQGYGVSRPSPLFDEAAAPPAAPAPNPPHLALT